MSQEIERLDRSHYDELIAFLGKAFDKPTSDWFATHLPSLYQPTDEAMGCNFAARTGGNLAAVVGVFPMTLQWSGCELKCAGIGGVSTASEARGKGLMRELMTHIRNHIDAADYDLSWLGGRRQRYQYHGYERAGVNTYACLNADNIQHRTEAFDAAGLVNLTPLADASQADIDTLLALHNAQAWRCNRSDETFAQRLNQWAAKPFVVHDPSGGVCGYLVLNNSANIVSEIVTSNTHIAFAALKQVVRSHGDVRIWLPPVATDFTRALHHVCEDVCFSASSNWRIVNYERAIAALLRIKHTQTPLPHGKVVIGIEGQARALKLQVDTNSTSCQYTDAAPAITLDELLITQLLLGPAKPSDLIALPPAAQLLNAWCPLPASIAKQDEC